MRNALGTTTTSVLGPASPLAPRGRELEVVGDIAHAVLRAARPIEVYRLALDRVTPLVGARFSSVFLRDPEDPSLLRLECAHNWPQATALLLGQVRIREGRGPTGRAAADGITVEAENVFADPTLRDWWEPARELGFASLISLPLVWEGGTAGALTFYFERPHRFDEDERRLLALIADQLAATASRAHLVERLRLANDALEARNAQLAQRLEEGEQLRRLKDEFLANVSHELRTPLTSILGYAQLLGDGELGSIEERQLNAVRRIEAAGTVLLRLICDLLELSHLKLDRVRATPVRLDAVGLARRATAETGDPPAGVHFALVVPDSPVPVVTDGEKVVRILARLLANAFKFTPQGEVELRVCGHDDGSVLWSVRDTGIGVAERDREAIFDEFQQVDGSTTRLYGGTGLGLALSRRLAELLGGVLSVHSEPGVGSTFTLLLPPHPNGR